MLKLRWNYAMKMASEKEKVISLKKKEGLLREGVNTYWKRRLLQKTPICLLMAHGIENLWMP